jgi:transposase
MLKALAAGETDARVLAGLADANLRATGEQLCDALEACRDLHPLYRRLLQTALDEWEEMERRIQQLQQEMATLLRRHQDQVQRLAEIPGLGVDSAQQILAEVGAEAATFPSAGDLASWVGACPGQNQTAGVNASPRSPKGNRHLRRILNQAANAAVKLRGSIFALLYRRYVSREGHKKTIAIIAHRLCRLIWMILHRGLRYQERGPALSKQSARRRATRMIRELRSLGYRVELTSQPVSNPA